MAGLALNMISAQEIDIPNGQFVKGTDSWKSFGKSDLTHTLDGDKKEGTALLTVHSNGKIGKAGLSSSKIKLPSDRNSPIYILSYEAHGTRDGQRTRIRIRFTASDGSEHALKPEEIELNKAFTQYEMPVVIPEDAASMQLFVECGLKKGEYFFDAFNLRQINSRNGEMAMFEEWEPRQFLPANEIRQTTLGDGVADITLTCFPGQEIAPVLPTQFGVNSNVRSGNSLVNRAPLYEGFGAFRFPAGSGSNQYFWDCEIPSSFAIPVSTLCGTSSQFMSPANFLKFRENAEGEPTVVVNYFYARYGTTPEGTREARVRQAAQYAASMVHFFNIENNGKFKYWEVGNECYGPWETGYDVNGSIVTGKEYGEDFRIFVEEMKAVDPTIKIGAVLSHNRFEWNNQVLKEVEDDADFLIVHHYFTISDGPTAEAAVQEIALDMMEIRAAVESQTSKPAGHFPVAFTEFNIQGDQATTIMNGLFTADALGTMVESRFSMTNIWVNEWKIDGNHSKGLLAKEDPDQPDFSPRPTYTPYYFYDKYFGDRMIATSQSGPEQVKAYASLFTSGETGIVLINYSESTKTIRIGFDNAGITADSIYWHTVHAENKNPGNKKFFINGETGPYEGGGPEDFDSVPAYAAGFGPGKVLELPQLSATYLVLTSDIATSTGDTGLESGKVFPNPTNGLFTIATGKRIDGPIEVFDLGGANLTNLVTMISKGDTKIVLDGSRLPKGAYLVHAGGKIYRVIRN